MALSDFYAAGHHFVDDVCIMDVLIDGVPVRCSRKWIDIMHVDETYIGAEGYAHIGKVNADEARSVAKVREDRARVFAEATHGYATGGGSGSSEGTV